MTKRLVMFNHKGGVSKTTTVYNLGWMLSRNYRVLLVDGDPQCNLTSLILKDDFDSYYFNEETKLQNIKDGVSPAFSGKPVPIKAIDCPVVARSPNLHLIPGHANLSEYDASLTFAQNSNNAISTLQNLPGAFNELLRLVEEKYGIDYTLIDLNPGLSAINQNLFLNSDVFAVPTNPDPFSIMALDTLKTTLPRWASWKQSAIDVFSDSAYPLRDGLPKFGGAFIQRFNVRNGRAAKPYRENITEIKSKITNELVPALHRAQMTFDMDMYPEELKSKGYCLEEIQDFGGLLPKAYSVGAPIFDLANHEIGETGPILEALVEKRDVLSRKIASAAEELVKLMNYA
ncbi:ParA family protein [Stutzerimonas stutzeri]|uniref:ParA family protein n=1 Tax=Stutzerimonas stutzeri TaxID=316 RepID=UPI0004CE4C95|nr:AAA family ATPase [Stutzerimonas stutzeri]